MFGIRTNKYLAVDDLNYIIHVAEELISKTKLIPEPDDEEYRDRVQGYRDRIHEIRLDLDEVFSKNV